jgi:hypothetical protein
MNYSTELKYMEIDYVKFRGVNALNMNINPLKCVTSCNLVECDTVVLIFYQVVIISFESFLPTYQVSLHHITEKTLEVFNSISPLLYLTYVCYVHAALCMTLHILSYLAKNLNTAVILIVSEEKLSLFASKIYKLHKKTYFSEIALVQYSEKATCSYQSQEGIQRG